MDTTGVPAQQLGADITSQIELIRSKPMVLHNSKTLWWITMSGSFLGAFLALCSVPLVFSTAFPLSDLTVARGRGIVTWIACALFMSSLCIYLWSLVKPMAGYKVYLDGRGVTFSLGTKTKPTELFMAWDQISAVKTKRARTVQLYWVEGKDGSEVRFSSYKFFRPKRVARMIAKRAGMVIQKV